MRDNALDKGALVTHWDTVLLLELVGVVIQKGLVASHLVSNGHHADLVDSLLDAHLLHGKEELLGNVEDLLGEVGPLGLRLDQRLPRVLLLLLKNKVMLLEH